MIYEVNGERYTTICSVHNELKEIFNKIIKIISNQNNLKEIIKLSYNGIEFTDIALDMGQRMENALRSKEESYNYLGIFPNTLNENLETVSMFNGESDD